jgi:hypothetical protein
VKNTFELEGKVLRIETFVTKAGKSIPTVVISIPDDKFPAQCGIKFWGRTAEKAASLVPGTTINVTGKLGGRDWNGRTFSEVIGQAFEIIGEIPAAQCSLVPDDDLGIPF